MSDSAKTQNAIVARLTSKFSGYIYHHESLLTDNEETYAINWFNTKSQWLYDLYNFLAAGSVIEVGGKPFMKGRLVNKLYGESRAQRTVLLIVRYPSVLRFKNMLESKMFQAVSILRSLAVSGFTFGFSKRHDQVGSLAPDDTANGKPMYGVIHFSGDIDINDVLALARAHPDSELIFASEIAGRLATGKIDSEPTAVPCIMNGIAVLRSVKPDCFKLVLESEQFLTLKNNSDDVFFGVYDRVF